MESIDWNKPIERVNGVDAKVCTLEGVNCAAGIISLPGHPCQLIYGVDRNGKPNNNGIPESFAVRNKKSVEEKALDISWDAYTSGPADISGFEAMKRAMDALKDAGLLRDNNG